MKIYAATTGEYSDYHIVGIFTDAELASKYGNVEEYDIDIPNQFPGREPHEVDICLETGDVTRHTVGTNRALTVDEVSLEHPLWRHWFLDSDQDTPPCEPGTYGDRLRQDDGKIYKSGHLLRLLCWATDKEHAIKLAGEKRKEYLAKKAGV